MVIDYGSGNLKSVYNAIVNLGLCDKVLISRDARDLGDASHIILPGVGAFADCMDGLSKEENMIDELQKQVLVNKKPFLGICVGMQVMGDIGYEKGATNGLGFIAGEVRDIAHGEGFDEHKYKIPQIGWNNLQVKKSHFIFDGVEEDADVYFANSYRFIAQNKEDVLASVDYGCEVAAAIAKDNILGIQFHPEKSGEVGLKFLRNFILN